MFKSSVGNGNNIRNYNITVSNVCLRFKRNVKLNVINIELGVNIISRYRIFILLPTKLLYK